MQRNESIILLLTILWRHVGLRRRRQLGLLLLLMLLASFAEIISIGAVLPFLGVLTAPERIFQHTAAQYIIKILKITSPEQLFLPISIIFGVAVAVTGAMRLILSWISTRVSFAAGADLSINVYRRTLYQPYAVHCGRNSSEIISGISSKTNTVIYGVIHPLLTLIGSSLMLLAIILVLLLVEPVVALATFVGFGLIYASIAELTRRQLASDSQRISVESNQVIKSLQEGLGGVRDVLLDGSQSTFCQIYRGADQRLRRAQGNQMFIAQSPRYAVEALGMALIAAVAYFLTQQPNGIAKAIPVLGALAVGAQRMLPVLQQAYASWTSIQGNHSLLKDTLELLAQPLPAHADQPELVPLPFTEKISLRRLGFRYDPQTPFVIRDINLDINKGSRVGIIGSTGSGKSTLLDIVMGLLDPVEGLLEVDGCPVVSKNQRAWQMHIAHVPQVIFLTDGTVAENIAFGVPKAEIDFQRVQQAAKQAKIADTINSWAKQYQTTVGERGIRLSGGQRQRIGIARALYKRADVIIFDEATNALDNETEKAVMDAIENLSPDLTVLIIAHRLTTLKNCSQIVELGGGGIQRVGGYLDIVSQPSAASLQNI